MTSDTYEQVLRSSGSSPTVKLSRMLLNTLRNYPRAKLIHHPGGFGVLLDETSYLLVSVNGSLNAETIRDLLALFATWLVVNGSDLVEVGTQVGGRSVEEIAQNAP